MVTAKLQTAIVAYFQSKIKLSGFSACPDGSPSQLNQISGVLLHLKSPCLKTLTCHSCILGLLDRKVEGIKILQNIGNYLLVDTV